MNKPPEGTETLADQPQAGLCPGNSVQVFFKPEYRPRPKWASVFGTFQGMSYGCFDIRDANLLIPKEMLDSGKPIDQRNWLIFPDTIIAIEERKD
jgi:hypothetical protein